MNKTLKNLLILVAALALVLLNQTGLLGNLTQPPAPEPTTAVVEQVILPERVPAPETEAPTQAQPEAPPTEEPEAAEPEESERTVSEDGEYTSMEDVALYIWQYGHLPSNYITKSEAEALGWVNKEGNLWKVAPGKSIGGDYFGNFEGALPKKKGRKYYECDIDFDGKYRNAKRILFSNDGLIYYTEDHYETFILVYGGVSK